MELINILIRTSNRPGLFKRCLQSVVKQTYQNLRIIVAYDNHNVNYIPSAIESIFVSADRTLPYFYDLYCNDLKSCVDDGYFMFLDDDDYLVDNVLSTLTIDHPALLYQYRRGTDLYPPMHYVKNGVPILKRGQVGMPCLLLHHSLKDIADIPGTGQGDYFWIDKVNRLVGVKFTPLVICAGDQRGFGKCS